MKHKYNRHPNQYSQSDPRGLYLLLATMALSAYLNYRFQPLQATLSPCPDTGCVMLKVQKVEAAEPIIKTPVTVEEKIRAMFPEDQDRAVAIAKCESGMRPEAFNGKNRNGSWDAGVFQVNSVHKYSKEYLFNVDNNLKVARKLYEARGNTWGAWVCARKVK